MKGNVVLMVNLCVYMTEQQGTQIFGQTLSSWCFCEGVIGWMINILIGRLSKLIVLPNVGGPNPISWRSDYNKNTGSPIRKISSTAFLNWDIIFFMY